MKTDPAFDEALALLLSSTLRKKRPSSLAAVADAIMTASAHLGSLGAVSDRVGISAKMLAQFLRVRDLIPETQRLVERRLIDSVDAVAHLARLTAIDQLPVARAFAEKCISTSDVRGIVDLRKRLPNVGIDELIAMIRSSKTAKEYVFEFIVRGGDSPEILKQRLSVHLPNSHTRDLSVDASKGRLTVDEDGYKILREMASRNKIPLKSILPVLLRREQPLP
jgi:hypothetical protein